MSQKGNTMFEYFETTSRKEREEIAANLKTLYNRWYNEESETFQALRKSTAAEYHDAQKAYISAVSKLGAIQAVFHELGIDFCGLFEEANA